MACLRLVVIEEISSGNVRSYILSGLKSLVGLAVVAYEFKLMILLWLWRLRGC